MSLVSCPSGALWLTRDAMFLRYADVYPPLEKNALAAFKTDNAFAGKVFRHNRPV